MPRCPQESLGCHLSLCGYTNYFEIQIIPPESSFDTWQRNQNRECHENTFSLSTLHISQKRLSILNIFLFELAPSLTIFIPTQTTFSKTWPSVAILISEMIISNHLPSNSTSLENIPLE